MAKRMNYAQMFEREKTPVVDGRQYRAQEVKILDETCAVCAASENGRIDKELCNTLPACTKSKRLDGRHVVFVDCGPALKAPDVLPVCRGEGAP